jgi:hypothetical protein
VQVTVVSVQAARDRSPDRIVFWCWQKITSHLYPSLSVPHSSMALQPFVENWPLFPYTFGSTPYTGDQSVARSLPTHAHRPDIDASSGIGTHDPSVRAGKASSCPRPRHLCDRPLCHTHFLSSMFIYFLNMFLVKFNTPWCPYTAWYIEIGSQWLNLLYRPTCKLWHCLMSKYVTYIQPFKARQCPYITFFST